MKWPKQIPSLALRLFPRRIYLPVSKPWPFASPGMYRNWIMFRKYLIPRCDMVGGKQPWKLFTLSEIHVPAKISFKVSTRKVLKLFRTFGMTLLRLVPIARQICNSNGQKGIQANFHSKGLFVNVLLWFI